MRGEKLLEWRVKVLLHLLLLRVSLLLSCPSHSRLLSPVCAAQALIAPGNSVIRATKASTITITREATKTNSDATVATLWTAPQMAMVTRTTTGIMAQVVTRGDQDKGGGCHLGQGRKEQQEEEEEEEGGKETETEVSIIINASNISTITIPTTAPTMHHSSPDLSPTTTACPAPGPRPHLRTCYWVWGHHQVVGASPPHLA